MNLDFIRKKLSLFSTLSLQNKIVTLAFAITLLFMIALGIPLLIPGVVIKQKKPASSSNPVITNIPTAGPRMSSTPAPQAKYRVQIYTIGTTETIPMASYTLISEDRGLQRMDDNGTIFYADNNTIYTYKLGVDTKTRLYDNPQTDYAIKNLDVSSGKLYLTKQRTGKGTEQNYSVDEINLASGAVRTLESLQSSTPVQYTHLFKAYSGDIILGYHAEGCAGQGMIYRYLTEAKELLKTGDGCTSDDRYIGFLLDSGTVVMATVDGASEQPVYKELYGFDVERLTTERIIDLQDIERVELLLHNDPLTKIAAATANELVIINPKTHAIERRIPFTARDYSQFIMTEVKLFAVKIDTNERVSVDLTTGTVRSIQIKGIKPGNRPVSYLGEWKKLPVFYYTIPL